MLNRYRYRKQRKAYRAILGRWNADGGDDRFRFDYDLQPDSVVVDFGGDEGQWASDLYARQRCRMYVFEPIPAYADSITRRFARNPDITVYPFALGAGDRTEYLSVAWASSSAHKNKGAESQVEFRDVRAWFDEAQIQEVAQARINIEGGEYGLLERMLDTDLVHRIDAIQVQYHYFVDNADERMARIQERVAVTRTPTWQYRYIRENRQRKDADA
jgi:FkbM family methyltransferase